MMGFKVQVERKRMRHLGLFLSFSIPFGIMLVLFIIKGIYPFGDRSFLFADLYHQYMPFFRELLYKVREGESLNFSFHLGDRKSVV